MWGGIIMWRDKLPVGWKEECVEERDGLEERRKERKEEEEKETKR